MTKLNIINYLFLILLNSAVFEVSCDKTSSKTISTSTITYPNISLNCDFEKDFCNWNNYTFSNSFFWKRSKANELLDINGPLPDHTLQSLDGHYVYIQSNSNQQSNKATSIRSAPFTVLYTTTSCFSFWYHMYGQAINTLNVKIENLKSNKFSNIWSKKTSQGNAWRLGQITVQNSAGNYRYVLEGIVNGNLVGDIAVDDIVVTSGDCDLQKYCDFESKDICDFFNSHLGIFNWTRKNGSKTTNGTGPSFDHTTFTNSGYYMNIESSSPRREGDNAILVSPSYSYSVSATRCIQIWYHAYGSDVGTLNVFKLEKSGVQGNYEKLFSISGDQGNEWHVTQINFYAKAYQDFNIVIEGIVDGKGDISIDDFEIRDKKCQPIGDCDFEEDTCAWKNAEKDADFEWIRNRGSTPSSFSGPSVDHTLGTSRGTYLFIETSSQSKQGSKALMVSPVFDRFTQRCFEFYYHMKGSSSTLSIIRKGFRSYLNDTVVWKDTSSNKDEWQQALVSLPNNFSSNYILIIEGKINGTNSGDIA
ncbi:unnamed protein product, partial [Brachionus calyciflorus]